MSDFSVLFPDSALSKAGGNEITVENGSTTINAVDYPLVALNLYGKSVQDGTPTPDAPIPIVSIGDDGAVVISCNNGSDNSVSATITSGLPLCSVGKVCDELIYNADGTGKVIKRLGIYTIAEGDRITIQENAGEYRRFQFVTKCTPGEALCTSYKYGTGFATASPTTNIDQYAGYFTVFNGTIRFISNELTADEFIAANLGVTVVYQLDEPQEIELSATEMAALAELQTFEGVTNIFNDEGAEMAVKAATNPLLSEYVKPVIDGIAARYEARIAALEAAITST